MIKEEQSILAVFYELDFFSFKRYHMTECISLTLPM